MDNNLSELSKPEAYVFDHGVMGPGDFSYGTPQMHSTAKDENARPLYSQEYVSALLADNEGMEQTLNVANDAIRLWKERALAAEKRLATPVRLQSPWADHLGNRWLLEGTTADAIRAAGFKCVGDEQ